MSETIKEETKTWKAWNIQWKDQKLRYVIELFYLLQKKRKKVLFTSIHFKYISIWRILASEHLSATMIDIKLKAQKQKTNRNKNKKKEQKRTSSVSLLNIYIQIFKRLYWHYYAMLFSTFFCVFLPSLRESSQKRLSHHTVYQFCCHPPPPSIALLTSLP